MERYCQQYQWLLHAECSTPLQLDSEHYNSKKKDEGFELWNTLMWGLDP